MKSFVDHSIWESSCSLSLDLRVWRKEKLKKKILMKKSVLLVFLKKTTSTGPTVSRLLVEDEENRSSNQEKTIYEYCQDGDIDNVERILKKKFDVNKPDEMVVFFPPNRIEVKQEKSWFSFKAIDIDALGRRSWTRIYYSFTSKIWSWLERSWWRWPDTFVLRWTFSKCPKEKQNEFYRFVLAAHSSSFSCIKTLLELGADANIPNNDGELPSSVTESEEKACWKTNWSIFFC